MIYKGDTQITRMYKGDTEITAVYHGDVCVYQNLFSGWVLNKSLNAATGVITDGGISAVTDYIPVNFTTYTDYTIMGLTDQLYSFVYAYDSNMIPVGRTAGKSQTDIILQNTSFTAGAHTSTDPIAYIVITQYRSGSGWLSDLTDNVTIYAN